MFAKLYSSQNVIGWFMSEKLDGVRCRWEGGKLLSRYDNEFNAPLWWKENLPPFNVEGELYMGRKKFSDTVSIVRRKIPDSRWELIKLIPFDIPHSDLQFFQVVEKLREVGGVKQKVVNSLTHMEEEFDKIIEGGGEGLMLRNPYSKWTNKRSDCLLKLKPVKYGTGKIVGFTGGKGKYRGRLGAIILDSGLKLSGMSDKYRSLYLDDIIVANNCVGKKISTTKTPYFKIGQEITYKYRDLSKYGVPLEARICI